MKLSKPSVSRALGKLKSEECIIVDNNGHIAGDTLLKNAATKLMEVFPECEIYRAGGDEFLIISVDLPEELMSERVERLRLESEDPNNISFSLGQFFDDQDTDIRIGMRTADERMYADKERYYEKFPERKRR